MSLAIINSRAQLGLDAPLVRVEVTPVQRPAITEPGWPAGNRRA